MKPFGNVRAFYRPLLMHFVLLVQKTEDRLYIVHIQVLEGCFREFKSFSLQLSMIETKRN